MPWRQFRLGRVIWLVAALCPDASAELKGRWVERDALLGADAYVYDLTVFRGELIAAGRFRQIGGVPANCVARFDGTTWRALGEGVQRVDALGQPATDAWVENLFEYQGDLIIVGRFTHANGLATPYVARWDGETFHPMGGGTNSRIAAIASNDGALVVGGFFSHADGVVVNRVSSWGGSGWSPMERGFSAGVTALYEFRGELWAGGLFMLTGTRPARCVARWADGLWMGVEPGFVSNSPLEPAVVFNFAEHAGELYAVGQFHRWGDSARVTGIARWSEDAWVAVGAGLSTSGGSSWGTNLTTFRDELVVVGYMERAGGEIVNNIAAFDGERWAPVGLGTNAEIKSCTAFGDELYIAGLFTRAGPYPAHHLAVWTPEKTPPPITQLQLRVFPNPTWNAATIHTELLDGAVARLELFDARGRIVRTWGPEQLALSRAELPFDGKDGQGRELAAGIYHFRLSQGSDARRSALVLRRR